MGIITTLLGFKKPDRRELLRTLADSISHNAQAAQDLIAADQTRLTAVEKKTAAQDTDIATAQSGAVGAARTYTDERVEAYRTVDRALWRSEDDGHQAAAEAKAKTYTDQEVGKKDLAFRGKIPAGTDVSTWKTSAFNGFWLVDTGALAASITGLPPALTTPTGVLFHQASDNGMHFQEFRAYGNGVYGTYMNENTTFNSGIWRGWRRLLTTDDNNGTPLGNVNLSTVTTPGRYYPAASSSVTAANGYPSEFAGLVGPLEVENWTNNPTTAIHRIQTYKPWSSNKFAIRHIYNGGAEAAWAVYEPGADLRSYVDGKIAATIAPPGVHQRAVRLSSLRHRVGPVSTGGKGAITLVMDHGTNKVKEIVPLLQARGLRATLALNSDMYNPATPRYSTNNLTTWSEIKGWHDAGTLEIANHGRTHFAGTTYAEIDHEIRGGRTELETNLPGVVVDSWVQPGSGSSLGFEDGTTLAAYYETDAGRIILDNHAVVTGQVPGTRLLPLTGEPIIGFSGSWIDTGQADIDNVKNLITSAGAQKRGFTIRFHPESLDRPDRITTAQLTEFLDWIVARPDVVVLPLREFAIATR
ncbi:polysaccharide deacetylase family protein [Arthrobacter sp. SX1312]|uniref:polysaccharide deacetylase family protein n=1 Tax=Arthrobacter sp. SX1312 TaxID=2058896 RepID=UPI000CE2E13A|nr:polysaccharide deacetylase family protein [Arthrobacter sp. SX1312]